MRPWNSLTIIHKSQCKTWPDSKVFRCLRSSKHIPWSCIPARRALCIELWPTRSRESQQCWEKCPFHSRHWALVLPQKVALGTITTQAPSPGDLTLSNTHDVLTNASGPESCQWKSGLTIAICPIFALENSIVLPCFSLKGFPQQGLTVLFFCLTGRRDYSSTMILRLGLLWRDLCFPGLNPCLLHQRPRVTDLLPNSWGSEPNFTYQLRRKVFSLSTHWRTLALPAHKPAALQCQYNPVLNVLFEVDLLGHMLTLCVTFQGYAKLFF